MQVSWIDAAEVSSLIDGLRAPLPEEQENPQETAQEQHQPAPPLTSPPRHADLEHIRRRLDAIRSSAMQAGLLSPQQTAIEKEPRADATCPLQLPPGSTVAERFTAFASWASPKLSHAEILILGDQGDLLWGRSACHQGFIITTVMAWIALTRRNGAHVLQSHPVLRQPMTDGGHLLVLPCLTRLGLLHLAITTAQPIPDEELPSLATSLKQALEST
ncbi:MAG: hypothetical protein LDL31_06760 [Prosthecobacter sp.]|nr:hypothetical protein [Prosthecobacter sp.]